MAKPKAATAKEAELNRWCIEMAISWPLITTSFGGGGVSFGGGGGQVDADVIDRAGKILSWVKISHQ